MSSLIKTIAFCALLGASIRANAAVTVSVDPSAPWQGYMNVFDLPADGGAYKFGSGWGTADLNAGFAADTLTLTPNTSISRDVATTDAYWWKPDGSGNKNMDANFYVENSTTLPGQEVTFTGMVLENSLITPYTSVAFIKDFAPDYSSNVSTTAALAPGAFSISLATTTGHHIQYGFETMGPNASLADVQRLGKVRVTAASTQPPVPEPSSLALMAPGLFGVLAAWRKRRA
ncbi:MAG TPA: PEP-CTERM sorting domain-containing protein [Armatimonadota bacterium]|jgi:hypothetical protein